jgi:hypothetical protein
MPGMRRLRAQREPTARTWLGTAAQVVRHVDVCGMGQLANATRIELSRLGIHRDTDYLLPSVASPLLIACGDSETDESFHEGAQRAAQNGFPILLACLTGRVIRVGPLILPEREMPWPGRSPDHPISQRHRRGPREISHLGRRASLPVVSREIARGCSVAEAGPLPGLQARLGALLISAQTLNFLLGRQPLWVLDKVLELNPWSMESKGYRITKVRQ